MLNLCNNYPSGLTDKQFELIESLLPTAKNKYGVCPRKVNLREAFTQSFTSTEQDASEICSPYDLLPKNTVYDYFAQFRGNGT